MPKKRACFEGNKEVDCNLLGSIKDNADSRIRTRDLSSLTDKQLYKAFVSGKIQYEDMTKGQQIRVSEQMYKEGDAIPNDIQRKIKSGAYDYYLSYTKCEFYGSFPYHEKGKDNYSRVPSSSKYALLCAIDSKKASYCAGQINGKFSFWEKFEVAKQADANTYILKSRNARVLANFNTNGSVYNFYPSKTDAPKHGLVQMSCVGGAFTNEDLKVMGNNHSL